jgi:hypothetical protein
MEDRYIKSISSKVYRQFPEVKGVRPKVRLQSGSGDASKYLLTFQGEAVTASGKSISRLVRVVASATGSIIKITTSR